MIYDVQIGDCEGRCLKHKYYIKVLPEDVNKSTLTEVGKEKFKSLWDTYYNNYKIIPLSKNEIIQLKIDIQNQIINLNKEFDILNNS